MLSAFKRLVLRMLTRTPGLRAVAETRRTQTPVRPIQLLGFWLRRRRGVYWQTHPSSVVVDPQNILAGIETSPGSMPGCYIQGSNGIIIGDYTQIAANVVMISANHALTDNRAHIATGPIEIGSYSWLGANVVILPGVKLGEYTVVGAGAVVTKSFEDGYTVLAGNPAKPIRHLDPQECVKHVSEHEYYGFIPKPAFDRYRREFLRI